MCDNGGSQPWQNKTDRMPFLVHLTSGLLSFLWLFDVNRGAVGSRGEKDFHRGKAELGGGGSSQELPASY